MLVNRPLHDLSVIGSLILCLPFGRPVANGWGLHSLTPPHSFVASLGTYAFHHLSNSFAASAAIGAGSLLQHGRCCVFRLLLLLILHHGFIRVFRMPPSILGCVSCLQYDAKADWHAARALCIEHTYALDCRQHGAGKNKGWIKLAS
jgi:hypothetical protein